MERPGFIVRFHVTCKTNARWTCLETLITPELELFSVHNFHMVLNLFSASEHFTAYFTAVFGFVVILDMVVVGFVVFAFLATVSTCGPDLVTVYFHVFI